MRINFMSKVLSSVLLVCFATAMPVPALAAVGKVFVLYNYFGGLGDPSTIQQFNDDSASPTLALGPKLVVAGYVRDLVLFARQSPITSSDKLFLSVTNGVYIVDLRYTLGDSRGLKYVAAYTTGTNLAGKMSISTDKRHLYIPYFESGSWPRTGAVKVLDITSGTFLATTYNATATTENVNGCDATSTAVSSSKLYVGCFQWPYLYEYTLGVSEPSRVVPLTQPAWQLESRLGYLYMALRTYSGTEGGFWYLDPMGSNVPAAVDPGFPDAYSLCYFPNSAKDLTHGRYVVGGGQATSRANIYSVPGPPPSYTGQSPWIGYADFAAVAADPINPYSKGYLGRTSPSWNLWKFDLTASGMVFTKSVNTAFPPAAVAGRAINK